MIASDINHSSIALARDIVRANGQENLIDVRHQVISENSFDGVLCTRERIDFATYNPPFYSSREAFQAENSRKLRGLSKSKKKGSDNSGNGERGCQMRRSSAHQQLLFQGLVVQLWRWHRFRSIVTMNYSSKKKSSSARSSPLLQFFTSNPSTSSGNANTSSPSSDIDSSNHSTATSSNIIRSLSKCFDGGVAMEDAILSEEERAAIAKARGVSLDHDDDGAYVLFGIVILVARQIDFMFDIY